MDRSLRKQWLQVCFVGESIELFALEHSSMCAVLFASSAFADDGMRHFTEMFFLFAMLSSIYLLGLVLQDALHGPSTHMYEYKPPSWCLREATAQTVQHIASWVKLILLVSVTYLFSSIFLLPGRWFETDYLFLRLGEILLIILLVWLTCSSLNLMTLAVFSEPTLIKLSHTSIVNYLNILRVVVYGMLAIWTGMTVLISNWSHFATTPMSMLGTLSLFAFYKDAMSLNKTEFSQFIRRVDTMNIKSLSDVWAKQIPCLFMVTFAGVLLYLSVDSVKMERNTLVVCHKALSPNQISFYQNITMECTYVEYSGALRIETSPGRHTVLNSPASPDTTWFESESFVFDESSDVDTLYYRPIDMSLTLVVWSEGRFDVSNASMPSTLYTSPSKSTTWFYSPDGVMSLDVTLPDSPPGPSSLRKRRALFDHLIKWLNAAFLCLLAMWHIANVSINCTEKNDMRSEEPRGLTPQGMQSYAPVTLGELAETYRGTITRRREADFFNANRENLREILPRRNRHNQVQAINATADVESSFDLDPSDPSVGAIFAGLDLTLSPCPSLRSSPSCEQNDELSDSVENVSETELKRCLSGTEAITQNFGGREQQDGRSESAGSWPTGLVADTPDRELGLSETEPKRYPSGTECGLGVPLVVTDQNHASRGQSSAIETGLTLDSPGLISATNESTPSLREEGADGQFVPIRQSDAIPQSLNLRNDRDSNSRQFSNPTPQSERIRVEDGEEPTALLSQIEAAEPSYVSRSLGHALPSNNLSRVEGVSASSSLRFRNASSSYQLEGSSPSANLLLVDRADTTSDFISRTNNRSFQGVAHFEV